MARSQRFSQYAAAVSVSACLMGASPSFALAASLIPQDSSLGLDTVGYFHTPEGPQGFQNSLQPELIGRLSAHGEGPVLEGSAQGDLMLIFHDASRGSGKPEPYLEAPELYVGTSHALAPLQVEAGRQLEAWNHLDDQWNLGIWQPRFRWDYLHPETVGLTGAFVRIEQPTFKVVGLYAPIFIPERGVPIAAGGGTLSSQSRWFVPPPASISLFGQSTPVQYDLAMPSLGDLVLHPGGSLMARVGRDTGAWGSMSMAYKPVNQLVLADTGLLQLSSNRDAIHGDAKIYPRVVYHELISAEGGYQSEPVNAWFSLLGEHPLMDATPADWTSQELAPSLAMSSSVDVKLAGSHARPTRLDLSYLHQWGGNTGDQGPDASGGGASNFEARYPYQSALAMGLRSDAVARFSASTRLIYDIGHQGTIWSTEIRFQPSHGNWLLGVGADLLTSEQNDDPEDSDLIGHFNANDRVHAGVTYVF